MFDELTRIGRVAELARIYSLLDDRPDDWRRAEAVVDEIRARFGARSVGPASLTGPDGLRVARRGAQQWGPDER